MSNFRMTKEWETASRAAWARPGGEGFQGDAEGDARGVGEEIGGIESGAEDEVAGAGLADRIEPSGAVELEELDGPGEGESGRADAESGTATEEPGEAEEGHEGPEEIAAVFLDSRREGDGVGTEEEAAGDGEKDPEGIERAAAGHGGEEE